MARIIVVYGVIGGIIVALGMWVGMSAHPEAGRRMGHGRGISHDAHRALDGFRRYQTIP
jgi:hypothetical protein